MGAKKGKKLVFTTKQRKEFQWICDNPKKLEKYLWYNPKPHYFICLNKHKALSQ